jgi:hypothetical protein
MWVEQTCGYAVVKAEVGEVKVEGRVVRVVVR